jgi:hypothetical protein
VVEPKRWGHGHFALLGTAIRSSAWSFGYGLPKVVHFVSATRFVESIIFALCEVHEPSHYWPLVARNETLDDVRQLRMGPESCIPTEELAIRGEQLRTNLAIAALELSAQLTCKYAAGCPTEEARELHERRAIGMPRFLLSGERAWKCACSAS